MKVPANENEITLYCLVGEAIWKIQAVEQALSCSITLKMNPAATKEQADKVLKQHQSYTLGMAVNIASREKLYESSLQDELYTFLNLRNWLVHKAMAESHHDKNWENEKEELFGKIKSISDKAESIQHKIEYDMISFCSSKGKDMSKILELLKLQEQGVRVKKA
ncbi:MAG TPA: hypothetical protein PK325_04470 [Cyclobacteriaceae bacterium]|nr:hypothetical protein [Cyclobacteriaceae bacterium]HMU78581.1 hypothetical protein [Bacteroidia bacterium]HMX01757.1 hypothetical protein [Cyclobacteriaceae bacterium]HMX51504.1 hypothetical protein [Cyclobacteriaceae bacterium]HMY95581.1 hypothetical protein [Cyclobacteriaceae bacterium]